MLEWRDRNNQPETHSLFGQISSARRLKSRHCFLSSVQPANFPAKVIRCIEWRKRLHNKSHIHIINFHKDLTKGYDRYGPYGYASSVCACICLLAAKQKGKRGRSTQETPHVLVEKKKKPQHTWYSAPNSYIPALCMTLLC